MTEPLTHQRFEPCRGQAFEIDGVTVPCTLELIEVKQLADGPREPAGRTPFVLLFRGPIEPALDQGMYALRNERLGHEAMFLVPVGPDREGVFYEALFN